MSDPSRTCVSVYRRTVNASIERVWENVHDWEHLPWLHNASFSSIEHQDSGPWGWRAKIGLQPPDAGEILLELVRDDSQERYVSRTLAGPGLGTEIWTRLTEHGTYCTQIEVEFHVPGISADHVESVGAAFVALYTRLWDEDESMMVERTAQLQAGAAPIASPKSETVQDLGSLAALRARLPLVVAHAGRRFRIVEIADEIAIHACVCPHLLGPLEDCAVRGGRIRCPWHGFEFDVRSGRSSDGRGLRLRPPPRLEIDPAADSVRLVG
jgi:nitrite reductase/ring-hydroxylating ferredoxin subunit